MVSYEMRIKVRHDCPWSNISATFPDISIRIWCNTRSHIIELWGGPEEDLKALEREPALVGHDFQSYHEGRGVRIFSKGCDCDNMRGISDIINSMDCWYLEPLTIRGGWEHYRVFTYGRENLNMLVQEIKAEGGEVNVLSIRQLGIHGVAEPFLPSSSILAGLTDKQIQILAEAFSKGYFDEPSRLSADRLAEGFGVSRSTLSEHLRKAERKLLTNLYPVIQMACCDCTSCTNEPCATADG